MTVGESETGACRQEVGRLRPLYTTRRAAAAGPGYLGRRQNELLPRPWPDRLAVDLERRPREHQDLEHVRVLELEQPVLELLLRPGRIEQRSLGVANGSEMATPGSETTVGLPLAEGHD